MVRSVKTKRPTLRYTKGQCEGWPKFGFAKLSQVKCLIRKGK